MIIFFRIVFLLCAISLASYAAPQDKRDLSVIITEIEMQKARLNLQDEDGNKIKIRLNDALDSLKVLVTHTAAEKRTARSIDFATLWIKMNSVEGQSVMFPELLMRILEMPFSELVKNAIAIGLISEVPGAIRGCCAIESYYKFNHEKIAAMPDTIVLAFRTRLRERVEKTEKGLFHGIMIEMVDRGYYDSYNGYRCIHNKVTGCRITAE